MIKPRKSVLVFLICCALLGFAFLSLGGDFLHSQIHDHEQGAEQECPLYQFLVQVLITIVITIAATEIKVQYHFQKSIQSALSRIQFSLPSLRAPPIV